MAVTIRKRSKAGGGSGWIYVYAISGRSGVVTSNPVYQDSNSNVLEEITASGTTIRVQIKASYPLVDVNGTAGTLPLSSDGGHYVGYVDITQAVSGTIKVTSKTPDDTDGATDSVDITIVTPPQVVTLQFTGNYPGSQTELKAGDTFQISGTTDKACTGVEIQDYEACSFATITFASTTSFTVTGTIANRGTTAVLRPARLRARDASGAYGDTRDTNTGGGVVERVNLIKCNNLYPSVSVGTVSYPGGQTAIKNSETATVVNTVTNYTSVSYTSPTGELSITNPTTVETPKTVQRINGTYNVSTANLRIEAVRAANDAHTVATGVVRIAHVAATISVTEPYSRLRLGNPYNDYTVSIISNQELGSAPTMDSSASANSGVLQGSAWTGGLLTWTRVFRIASSSVPGTYGWRNLVATNRAGVQTTSISGDANYILGGFTQYSVTFPAFSQTTSLPFPVTTYSKLQAGIFTATNQQSIKNPTQGDHSNLLNTFTVNALGVTPSTIFWNDLAAANSNSSGTAQLLNVEELV